MYSKLLGIIEVRDKFIEFLEDSLSELSITCENIIVLDRFDYIESDDYRELTALYDFDCYACCGLDQYMLAEYDPDWVFTLYHDEIPSKRFRHFKDSLCANQLVNTFTSPIRYMWNFVDSYRTDKLWNSITTPSMFRYIPEIDYKWNEDSLVPTNQPGPVTDSSVSILSYRYLTERRRGRDYLQALREDDLNYYTRRHYESLMDEEIELKRWVD
jgi:hypothetical protein